MWNGGKFWVEMRWWLVLCCGALLSCLYPNLSPRDQFSFALVVGSYWFVAGAALWSGIVVVCAAIDACCVWRSGVCYRTCFFGWMLNGLSDFVTCIGCSLDAVASEWIGENVCFIGGFWASQSWGFEYGNFILDLMYDESWFCEFLFLFILFIFNVMTSWEMFCFHFFRNKVRRGS